MNTRAGLIVGGVVIVGLLARLSVLAWQEPWTPHHPDEHLLPLEALALWEGVTPRVVAWPAATTRLLLSGMAAGRWALDRGAEAWQLRGQPDRALESVATWIGQQYTEPASMYALGRTLSLLTGLLHLLVTWWALRRWNGATGQAAGMLIVAVSPVAVLHSQYVLADVTGTLFATVMVGLAAAPTRPRIVAMAAWAGLAAASKLHFGVWLLTPLLAILTLEPERRSPLAASALVVQVLAVFACVFLLFVPWWLIDPFLALRSVASIVGTKLGNPGSTSAVLDRTLVLFGGLGVLCWFGALAGTATLRRRDWRMFAAATPVVVAGLACAGSHVVFDRYGLVLLPGLVVLGARGWEHLWSLPRPGRLIGRVALLACMVVTSVQLVRAERAAGETDVDVAAKEWILANVPRGSRVAVSHDWALLLPRSATSLDRCTDYADTREAYVERWAIAGVAEVAAPSEPMRSGLMAGVAFAAHWCRRERGVQRDPGYLITYYHPEPRFEARLESESLRAFDAGDRLGEERPIDVLVLNRAALAAPPAKVIQSRRGQRVIYVRPGSTGQAQR